MRCKQIRPVLVLLVLSVLGCDIPLYEKSERRGLSNSEYITEEMHGGSGYPGASNIDTMCKYFGLNTGSGQRWTKVTISKADYEALWSLETELIREERYTSARADDGRILDRLAAGERLVPSDWPAFRFTRPSWWRLPAAGTPTEITAWRWTTGKEDASDTCYADRGCYWVYDAGSETLWVWSWDVGY